MHMPQAVSSPSLPRPPKIRQVTWRRLPAAWVALLAYTVLAVALFSRTWVDPAGSWIGSPKDPQLFIWYLGWIPHELGQGHNPLFTDFLSYPAGVNLMWNTSMIFPAVVLWPVTAAPWLLGTAGELYAVGAALLNAGFTGAAVQVCRDHGHRSARRMFTLSLLYLFLIFSLLLIDHTGGNWH